MTYLLGAYCRERVKRLNQRFLNPSKVGLRIEPFRKCFHAMIKIRAYPSFHTSVPEDEHFTCKSRRSSVQSHHQTEAEME